MRAAMRAGADAVYFGLRGHNARARAKNFDAADLPRIMDELHAWGVKGYVTLNTLAFDHELAAIEDVVRVCANAGVDAVIVQDLGIVQLCRAIAPELEVHASTQMTCSDAASVEYAASLGATRVVLARELSLDEVRAIRAATDVEIEVFVHGALCISYSGQCLTSEAIGGRSANRGACAQACRLPYDLVVDGVVRDLGDLAYLLSPEDLETAALVPALAELGVSCLKIEGRLKAPDYVAATTRLYRAAVDALGSDDVVDPALRRQALLTFSRGSGPGFFEGVNHQRLVDGHTCDHRGVVVGEVEDVVFRRGKPFIKTHLTGALARGDGVVVEGGRASVGEVGGRVWDIAADDEADGNNADYNADDNANDKAGASLLWLGPDVDLRGVKNGRRIFHNDDPAGDKGVLRGVEEAPVKEPVDLVVSGEVGAVFSVSARSDTGLTASVTGDAVVEVARTAGIDLATLREKLGGFGDTPFVLRDLSSTLPPQTTLPLSSLKRARRALEAGLLGSAHKTHATTTTTALALMAQATFTKGAPPPGLFVLCRTEEQAVAAFDAGADGVWLDFLAMQGLSLARDRLRGRGFVGVAPPRIRKPGEEKITKFLTGLRPDGVLVRGLGALHEIPATSADSTLFVGDFSLNVANRLTAHLLLSRGLAAITPSFDLDEQQLVALLQSGVGSSCELVVHHPMALFHMEHCVFAALLSTGTSYRDCGRPCESHVIALKDRAGIAHPVEADVGCRNTVFHAQAQSAAQLVAVSQQAGVGRFRIELVRETAAQVAELVSSYRALLAGTSSARETLKKLRTESGYGVVKGSLRVLA